MNFKYLICCLLFFGGVELNLACDCNSKGNFLKVAKERNFVSLVKIKKYLTFTKFNDKQVPTSMEVEILKIYKGKEKRKTVIVWGDNLGYLCRPLLSEFKLGKYFVIAFHECQNEKNNYRKTDEKSEDYFVSFCGEYWLDVDKDKKMAIGGKVSNSLNQISLKDLNIFFKNN